MKHIMSRVLIIIGLALVAAGKRIDKAEPPAAKCVIILPRRNFRPLPPSRWEVTKLGLSILFNSVAFATVGA